MELSTGLTLTIMLVMYTMYQSIIDTLAKTAYLKLIDYWLLFCLLMPFTTFMTEVYWLLRPTRVETLERNTEGKFLAKVLEKSFIQIFIPVVSILFVFSYFLAVIIIMATSA